MIAAAAPVPLPVAPAAPRSARAKREPLITVCPACGKKFGRRAICTIAAWRTFGYVRDEDVVHWGCRHVAFPKKSRPTTATARG